MRLTEPASLRSRSSRSTRLGDHARRPEQVDVRPLVAGQRPAHRRGDRVALHGQRGVAGARRPRRGGQRPFGAVGRVEHDVGRRLAARGRHEAVDRGGALERVVALDDGGLEARRGGPRPAPIRITCASLDRSEPLGSRRSSVSSVTAGRSSPSDSSSGAPIGGPARTAGGDRRLPVLRVDEHDRGRAVRAAGGREQRARDAGGVGDRVRAADADRVAGGAGGEAELLGRPGRPAPPRPSWGGPPSSSPSEQPPSRPRSSSAMARRRMAAQISHD